MSETKIIWADPIQTLAAELRREAQHHREEWGEAERAAQLERLAERVERAVEEGATKTWVPVAAVAELLGKHPETIRVRCRRHLREKGLARKEGGDWLVNVHAFAA